MRRRSFSLSIVGAGATGLFSTDNQAITLFDAGGGVIQGRYGAANTVAFTITINATTGDVTLTQLESLRHPTGGLASPDEFVSLAAGCAECGSDGDGRRRRRRDGDRSTLATSSGSRTTRRRLRLRFRRGATVVVDESLGQNVLRRRKAAHPGLAV